MDWLAIAISLSFSALLPIVTICVRQNVKLQRQDIIKDLEFILQPLKTETQSEPNNSTQNRSSGILSFEFVKFKYFVTTEYKQKLPVSQDIDRQNFPKDVSIYQLLLAMTPMCLYLTALGTITFNTLLHITATPPESGQILPRLHLRVDQKITNIDHALWLSVLMAAYFGSYLYIVRNLLRAIENFDLSPFTLLAAATHVLFGTVTAVLVAGIIKIIGSSDIALASILVLAFVVGFIPDLGLRTMLRFTHLAEFKKMDDIYSSFKSTPLEIIDGIDTDISSRLSDYHIKTVQNLASANPIMLFVETPYGVYQIIDWVAQAQLCAAVGPKKLTKLWSLGIRTIFDLERAVLDDSFTTPELRSLIGKILINDPRNETSGPSNLCPYPANSSDRTFVALVQNLVDDLHVQRLRQIWNRISERLGEDNLRLRKHCPRAPADIAA